MESIHNYFEAHRVLRTSVVCVLFCIASVTLFMVFTAWVFIGLPGSHSGPLPRCGFPIDYFEHCPSLRLWDHLDTSQN
jgi:hypothetical protein